MGEFDTVYKAEEVGVALQAMVPGSTLTTIDGRVADYTPPALAAAMATRAKKVGDRIEVDGEEAQIWAVHEFSQHRCFQVVFDSERTGCTVLDEQPYREVPRSTFDGKPQTTYLQYAIVERTVGEVETRTWYAYSAQQAEAYKSELEAHFQREFRVYTRPLTDPIAIARRELGDESPWLPLNLGPVRTKYLSIYAIGDEVVCKNHPAKVVGVAFTGDGHPTPGKVTYALSWLSGATQDIETFMSEDVYPKGALDSKL